MAVNQKKVKKQTSWEGSKADKKLVSDVMNRIKELQEHCSGIKANPYDDSKDARTIEGTWDFCDYVALPHKYSHDEMQSWMADNSHPMILAKIDTALSIIMAKNPEVEIAARSDKYDQKSLILEKMYDVSWDKGDGRQQQIKFAYNMAKYGTGIGREYHRYKKITIDEVVEYSPDGKHKTEKKEITINDEPYFETLPIRDVWIDNRARPYDWNSIRDWAWQVEYDYSTAKIEFEDYPNFKYIVESSKEKKDKAEVDSKGPKVRIYFYENKEDNEFIVTDGEVLIHKGPLLNNQLSLVIGMWKLRNEHTIYGLSLPEILENSQEMKDRILNMAQNQTILSIGGAGYYSGAGNIKEQDVILEPKLKKLRDAKDITFPKIPNVDDATFKMLEFIDNEADEISGVTKSLGGEQVGKTLGEAVLNREAGLRRLALPLQNLEFALERHAQLRVDNIQRIYSRPIKTEVVREDFENVIDEKLYQEYSKERAKGVTPELNDKFPVDENGQMFRNHYRTERLPIEKDEQGAPMATEQDRWLEITPSEIRGEYDVRIRAMSTIPMSDTLEEAKALETFNLIANLPYTDLYQSEKNLLKARKQDPEDWMKSEEDVIRQQQDAEGGYGGEDSFSRDVGGQPLKSPANLQQPASRGGLTGQITNSLKI